MSLNETFNRIDKKKSINEIHNMEEETLINRVANSGLVTIDLEQFFPKKDIFTFRGIVLSIH